MRMGTRGALLMLAAVAAGCDEVEGTISGFSPGSCAGAGLGAVST